MLDRTKRGLWVYRGTVEPGQPDTAQVVLVSPDGEEELLAPRERRLARFHSPAGYGWGYLGSGPAQLAQDLIRGACGIEPAPVLYQQFKEQQIAWLPREEPWELGVGFIQTWVNAHRGAIEADGQAIDLWADSEDQAVEMVGWLCDGDPGAEEALAKHVDELGGMLPADRFAALTIQLVRTAVRRRPAPVG